MNIVYLHGFGSEFSKNSDKVKLLSSIGYVTGFNIDYCNFSKDVIKNALSYDWKNVDLIVGTSMGGWLASYVANELDLPFVAINPSIEPYKTLTKYEGHGVDFVGNDYYLDESHIDSYQSMKRAGRGFILLDEDDDVISSHKTFDFIDNVFPIYMFKGGNHRFAHMNESLDLIKDFYYSVSR